MHMLMPTRNSAEDVDINASEGLRRTIAVESQSSSLRPSKNRQAQPKVRNTLWKCDQFSITFRLQLLIQGGILCQVAKKSQCRCPTPALTSNGIIRSGRSALHTCTYIAFHCSTESHVRSHCLKICFINRRTLCSTLFFALISNLNGECKGSLLKPLQKSWPRGSLGWGYKEIASDSLLKLTVQK